MTVGQTKAARKKLQRQYKKGKKNVVEKPISSGKKK